MRIGTFCAIASLLNLLVVISLTQLGSFAAVVITAIAVIGWVLLIRRMRRDRRQ